MSKPLRALVVSLQLFSLAASCAAQGVARTPKDEEPLAAALRLARGLGPESGRDEVFVRLVDAHREAGRLEEAARAAGAMGDGGMKAVALSRVANGFAEAGKLERAAELLAESLLVVKRADDDRGLEDLMYEIVRGERRFNFNSFPPDNEIRKGALARLVEAGRAEAAEPVLARLREFALALDDSDADAAHLLTRAARLYLSSDATKAAGLLSEALAAARRVGDDRDRLEAVRVIARAYADAGDKQAAESLLDEVQQSAAALGDERESELRYVASSYAAVGLTAKALKASREAGFDEWDVSSSFVEAAAAAGRPEALKESLTRALARVAAFEWDNSKSSALTQLAGAYGPRAPELLADVLWAARSVRDDYQRATALAAVGDRYAEAGRRQESLDAWGHAYESARLIKLNKGDYRPSSSIRTERDKIRLLRALGARLIRAGEHARASEIARDMRAVEAAARVLAGADDTTVHDSDASVAELADELARAGQKEAALAVLAEATGPDEKPGPYAADVGRAETLAALGAAHARLGDKARAAAYFRSALRLAEGHKDLDGERGLRVLIEVGSRYAEAGLVPDARARRSLRGLVRKVEADK